LTYFERGRVVKGLVEVLSRVESCVGEVAGVGLVGYVDGVIVLTGVLVGWNWHQDGLVLEGK
jgi:hypothetical protein